MFANFLIGLREGLEAALVVGILVAHLVKTGHRDRLKPLWAGVAAAVALSLVAGALLTFTSQSMSFKAQETFGGVTSLVAVAFVTWMIFWMRRTAASLKGTLTHKLDDAVTMGAFALAATAFIAVGREGLETALFVWTAVQAAGSTTSPVAGAVLGLLTSVTLGYLLYKRSVNLNLATFFRFTGAALIIVVAGVFAYGIHDFQEAGYLSFAGLHHQVFDASGVLPPSSWYGTLFKGVFSISVTPSRLELFVWVAYIATTMTLFLRPSATMSRWPRTSSELSSSPAPSTR